MAKRKDAPSSVLTRSGRKTSTGIQTSTKILNTIKSPILQKEMGPTTWSTVKKEPEKSEKQMGSTPLMRSERVASNVQPTEKPADISEEGAEEGSRDSEGGSKKRKRYHAVEFKACYKPQQVQVETEGSEVLTHTESPSSSGHQFWSAAVGNGTHIPNETADGNANSLYQHLKPTVSKLCNILKFSEGAKIIVERFLKFVVGNFNVSKEHTNILQALMISACWICSTLSTLTIDRKKSFALAKEHLKFSCKEEEADQVYEKLKKPKEMFLESPKNLKVLDAFKDRVSRPKEPRMSLAVPLNPQEHKQENHGSSNEEGLQSSGQFLDMENDVVVADAMVSSKPIRDIPDIKEIASEQHNEVEQVVAGDGAMVLTELIGDIPAKQHADREIDVAGQDESLELEVPEVGFNKKNAKGEGNSSPDGSHAVEARSKTGQNDSMPHVDLVEMEIPAINNLRSLVDSADASHAVKDAIGTGSNDGLHAIQDPPSETGHVDSYEMEMPADIDMAPNGYSADMSHAVEDPNKNGSNDIALHAESGQMRIPAANDLTPHIEYADGSHAVKDPNGTGPNHVAQNIEPVELRIPPGNCNQEKAHNTTPSVQQVVSPVSDHSMPAILDIHIDSHLLQQPSKNGIQDPEGQADPKDDNMQPVEAIQVDQIIPEDSSLNPHDKPSSVMLANPAITENQAAMLPTREVLAQTTAAQTQIQNGSLLKQYIFDLQRNSNSNQVGSRMTRRLDPLHIELEQLYSVEEKIVKSYHDNIQKINIDCEEEIAEAIAEIRLKYCNKRQEADTTFNSQKKEVENKMNTVVINQVLAATFRQSRQAATFRQKRQDVSRDCATLQKACQAEAMQQLHRFHGPSTCVPRHVSGTLQTPSIPATAVARPPQQTQPPLQIVHQPAALFLTPLTRHPKPDRTAPIRPPRNTETCGQSTQSRPLVSSVTRSTAPHMRALASSVIRTSGPHMRPLVNSDVRSSTSHMRPSNPVSSSQPPGSGTYHRTLPVQHVTNSVPLTSPSSSQPLNSTSFVQPLPPLPCKRFPVPQPRSE